MGDTTTGKQGQGFLFEPPKVPSKAQPSFAIWRLPVAILIQLSAYCDVYSVNCLFLVNKQTFALLEHQTALIKSICERLYPSTKLIQMASYLPYLQRKPGKVRQNKDFHLRVEIEDDNGDKQGIDLEYSLADQYYVSRSCDVSKWLKPDAARVLVLLDVTNRNELVRVSENRLRGFESEKQYITFSNGMNQLIPNFWECHLQAIGEKLTVKFSGSSVIPCDPTNSSFTEVSGWDGNIREELMTRSFYDPLAIIDSSCFVILLDVWEILMDGEAQGTSNENLSNPGKIMRTEDESDSVEFYRPCTRRQLFSGALELNDTETAFEGRNILLFDGSRSGEEDAILSDGFISRCRRKAYPLRLDFGNRRQFRSHITVVRADGAVFFRPKSYSFGDGLIGIMRANTFDSSSFPMHFLMHGLDFKIDEAKRVIVNASFVRHVAHWHSEGTEEWKKAGHFRNFGAELFGSGWNYSCKATVAPPMVADSSLKKSFASINPEQIFRGKFEFESLLVFVTRERLDSLQNFYRREEEQDADSEEEEEE